MGVIEITIILIKMETSLNLKMKNKLVLIIFAIKAILRKAQNNLQEIIMELIKDIIKALIEGIIEYKAENKISEKRKEYFRHRKGKWQKICFIASIILALTLVTIGLCLIIQRKNDRHVIGLRRYRNRPVHSS